jgi:uncharacterized protein
MYPFASLPENLAAFCRTLNRDYGYRVGARELGDAARALAVTPLGDERAVRDALRPVLGATRDDVRAFDEAFRAFFHPAAGRGPAGEPAPPPPEREASARPGRRRAKPADGEPPRDADDSSDAGDVADVEPAGDDRGRDDARARLRVRDSPIDATGPAPELGPAGPVWRDAARAFVRSIEAGRSRAWRPARRGPRFDLRRTLRTSLHTGGEVLLTRWRARPRRRPRFVLLIDGSRSMSTFSRPPLSLAVALAGVSPDVDVFVFSTALRRITPEVKLAAVGQRRRLPELAHAWGGGTSIGVCLSAFVRQFGERLLARRTVVIIASDGLDTGKPVVLRDAMARLQRLTAGVIWLNPLIETPGYEPTAAGMQTARPYVTTLAWVEDPAGVRRLARVVRLRR